jgi:hypothetical protein
MALKDLRLELAQEWQKLPKILEQCENCEREGIKVADMAELGFLCEVCVAKALIDLYSYE